MLPSKLDAKRYGQLLRLVDESGRSRAHIPFHLFAGYEPEATAFAQALCDAYNSIRDFQIEQENKNA